MSSTDRLRKVLVAVLVIQICLLSSMLIDQLFRLGFSGIVGILEFPLTSFPFVLVPGVLTLSGSPHLPLKKALVF